MKKIAFLSFVLIATVAFGQNSLPENINPVQAGTVTLVNGKATIALDENTITSLSPGNGGEGYFVQLTPIGNCGFLKIGEKGNKSFTVTMAGSGADNGSFDYVVFIKFHLIPIQQNIQPARLNTTPSK